MEAEVAAELNDPATQFELGNRYHLGQGGVQRDDVQAARLYQLAANQGHSQAQFNLGVL